MWARNIVVRSKNGKYYHGFASDYPVCEGYTQVENFGSWYGSQMKYKPFMKAMEQARLAAEQYNQNEGK